MSENERTADEIADRVDAVCNTLAELGVPRNAVQVVFDRNDAGGHDIRITVIDTDYLTGEVLAFLTAFTQRPN